MSTNQPAYRGFQLMVRLSEAERRDLKRLARKRGLGERGQSELVRALISEAYVDEVVRPRNGKAASS